MNDRALSSESCVWIIKNANIDVVCPVHRRIVILFPYIYGFYFFLFLFHRAFGYKTINHFYNFTKRRCTYDFQYKL